MVPLHMSLDALDIVHDEVDNRGAFFIHREGRRLAEMTYTRASDRLVIIDHTEVQAELQHHGVARRLLDAAVAWARATGTRISATCSYVMSQFDQDPSIRDVLDT